jgi:hypothetical protein
MAQLFRPRADAWLKLIALGLATILILGGVAAVQYNWGPWTTNEEWTLSQPVPFSHEHHVSGLGIACRYCHAAVETASSAGMPSTQTCMTCHSQIWTEAEVLEPVRTSYRTNQPLHWKRVYDLPDYTYFDHSIHVNNGVGCETCHGRVDQMPLMRQVPSLHMKWCLDCHRAPEQYLRPEKFIYAFGYDRPREEQLRIGRALIDSFDINVSHLDDCSICHR